MTEKLASESSFWRMKTLASRSRIGAPHANSSYPSASTTTTFEGQHSCLNLEFNACLSMFLRYFLPRLLSLLLPTSIVALLYLYLYPAFRGCVFPTPDTGGPSASAHFPFTFLNTVLQHVGHSPDSTNALPTAPFRLLVLADPQIEG